MKSILDWIGFSVNIASLKAFFAQKSLTILAVWEALNSSVRRWRHSAAFDVLLSVHLSVTDQAPWAKNIGGQYFNFSSCVRLAPTRAATLIKAYPCDQSQLDKALRDAAMYWAPTHRTPPALLEQHRALIELVKQLIRAGASLKNNDCRPSVDGLVRYLGDRKGHENDLALLELLFKAGAGVDMLSRDGRPGDFLSWWAPGDPCFATDYLLLNMEHSTHNHHLWLLISSHSDRQQTTVTVPGIFEAVQGGLEQLRFYLNSRLEPSGDQERQQVLQIALSEASGRGYVTVVQNLVQLGVDPNVRMLPPHAYSCFMDQHVWHPVIRALNSGEVETVRILAAVPSIDTTLLDEKMGAQLDICALRNMDFSRRIQTMRALSILNLGAATRSEILLSAILSHRCQLSGHDSPDFGYASLLLQLGLVCLDHPEHLEDGTGHILVRAIKRGCGIGALNYLIGQDVKVLSALSTTTIEALLYTTLARRDECREILEFLAQKIDGFESFLRGHSSSLLASFLSTRMCHIRDPPGEHWQEDCEAMVIVKWVLDLGASLERPVLAALVRHNNDSFMLTMIRKVASVDAVNYCDALRLFICLGRLNLAVALIERGAPVNGPQIGGGEPTATILQEACGSGAPLWFIRFLVDKGADVNASSVSNVGSTALQTACESGSQLSCIRFLIEKGARVNAPPPPRNGLTALQGAASGGFMNIAGLLLDNGADVNALSGFCLFLYPFEPLRFMRALDLAAQSSRLDMVYFLIASGARSCRPGGTGFDGAIEIATRRGNFAVSRLLQEHADSRSEDPLEAERRWLRANSHACLCNGRIQDAGWVAFVKRTGGDSEEDFNKYMEEQLDWCNEKK